MLAIATSVVPGIPMRTRYHRYRHLARPALVRADFAAASSWLADLQADSAAEAAPISLLDGIPQLMLDRWPADPRAAALAEMLGPVAARLASGRTSRTVAHGDFWAGNILLTGNVVTGVVDWPSGHLAGEPLGDVARFALSYALYLDRHTRPRRAQWPAIPGCGPTAGGPASVTRSPESTGSGASYATSWPAPWIAWAHRRDCSGTMCCLPA